jgi:hypothetical protein
LLLDTIIKLLIPRVIGVQSVCFRWRTRIRYHVLLTTPKSVRGRGGTKLMHTASRGVS